MGGFFSRNSVSQRKCCCIQINTKLPSHTTPLDQLRLHLPNGLPKREQLVGIAMVILPGVRESRANIEVTLEIRSFFVGVDDEDVIMSARALGFYPYRVKLWIEPELGEMKSSVNIVTYNFRDGDANSSTHITSSNGEIGAQLKLWPVSLSLKKTWGRSVHNPMEYDSITVGVPGNIAELEWKLLRWNHNGMKYNPSKPYYKLNSLKPPLRGGRTRINVEDFPIVVWHLPASMASKFPLRFKLRLEAEMHLLWYARSNWVYRKAKCTSERIEFSHEFLVTEGE